MLGYVARRVLQGLVVIFIVSLIAFFTIQAAPGDPIDIMLNEGTQEMTPETLERVREKWGLNDPWYTQYAKWSGNLLTGDLGISIVRYGTPVHEMILSAAPTTIKLNVFALILSLLIAIPAGIIAAIRRYSFFDSIIMAGASAGVAMPNFWVALMGIVLFASTLRWLPSHGTDGWKAWIMPVIVLAITEIAIITRLMRGAMLEVLNEDYVTTARAKGLTENVVMVRHAVRNALLPIITVIGFRLAFLLSGSVVLETVFALPGLGQLFYSSIFRFDYQVVQGIVLVVTITVIIANIVTDLLYALIDPRIRLR